MIHTGCRAAIQGKTPSIFMNVFNASFSNSSRATGTSHSCPSKSRILVATSLSHLLLPPSLIPRLVYIWPGHSVQQRPAVAISVSANHFILLVFQRARGLAIPFANLFYFRGVTNVLIEVRPPLTRNHRHHHTPAILFPPLPPWFPSNNVTGPEPNIQASSMLSFDV